MYKANAPLNMTKKPAFKDWHVEDIKAAVRKTGTNLSELSIQYGLARGVLRNALYSPYPRYERLIAEYLGVTPQTICPSRYNKDGSSRSGRGERGMGRYKPKSAINNAHCTPASSKCNGNTTYTTRRRVAA